MRLIKVALAGLILFGLWFGWTRRGAVVEAYTASSEQTEIRLNGIDLTIEQTKVDPSPYVVSTAPDTRRRPIALLFTAEEGDEVEVAMYGGESTLSGRVRTPLVRQPETTQKPSSAATGSGRGSNRSPQPAAEAPPSTEPASPIRATSSASGGIVRLERFTSEGVGVRDVSIQADGRWSAGELPGGRYRVRGWVPGRFSSGPAQIIYLNADDSQVIDMDLIGVDTSLSLRFHEAGSIYRGLSGSVGISASRQSVDENGIIVTRPVSGLVLSANVDGVYNFQGPSVRTTGSSGSVVFNLRCHTPGTATLFVNYNDSHRRFSLPACVRAPKPAPITVPNRPPAARPINPGTGASTSSPNPAPSTTPTLGPTTTVTASSTSVTAPPDPEPETTTTVEGG